MSTASIGPALLLLEQTLAEVSDKAARYRHLSEAQQVRIRELEHELAEARAKPACPRCGARHGSIRTGRLVEVVCHWCQGVKP